MASKRNLVVIYPGRFQPFHKGHKAVVDYLLNRFDRASDEVFVATSDIVDPPRSPFSFAEKKKMMELTGMDTRRVVQTKNPYQAMEIVQNFDKENTVLFFAVSAKDMAEDPRFTFAPKKDGSPSYFQPEPEGATLDEMDTLGKHGYIITVPTFDFKVLGKPMKSATEVRSNFAKLDDKGKKRLIKDLFGNYSNDVFHLMSNKITEIAQGIDPDKYRIFTGAEGVIQQATKELENIFNYIKDIPPGSKVRARLLIKFNEHIDKIKQQVEQTVSVNESNINRNTKMKSRKIGSFTKGKQQVGLYEAKGRLLLVDAKSRRVQESSENVHRTVRLLESKGWVMEVDMMHNITVLKNAAGSVLKIFDNGKGETIVRDKQGGQKDFNAPSNRVVQILQKKGFEIADKDDAFDTGELSLEPMEPKAQAGSHMAQPISGRILTQDAEDPAKLMANARRPAQARIRSRRLKH